MSRKRTRGHLLDRVKRYQQTAAVDASQDALTRAFIDDAVGRVYTYLADSQAGYLQTRRTYVITTETELLVLPANFEDVLALRLIVGGTLRSLTYESEIEASRYPDTSAGTPAFGSVQRYQIEGPGQDYDSVGDVYTDYDQRLRFTPALEPGSELRLSYATQPPSLADVDGGGASLGTYTDVSQDATLSVDVISEPIEEAITRYAQIWSAARGDAKDYQRAQQGLAEVAGDYLQARQARNRYQPDRLDRYRAGGQGGY